MQGVVVHHDRSVALQTTAESTNHKVNYPPISQPASDVEIFYWKLSYNNEAENTAELCTWGIVSPVKIWAINWSRDFFHLSFWEPASENCKVMLGFVSPGWHPFLKIVLWKTKANQFIVGHVVWSLRVDFSALEIIVSVLLCLWLLPTIPVPPFQWDATANFAHLL